MTSAGYISHRLRPRGFTVLELLMAVTVFALVSTAVFMVFRTGTRTYQFSSRDAVTLQRARFVFDTFERDLHNIFYRSEDSYNRTVQNEIEEWQGDMERVEAGEMDMRDFENKWGPEGERANPFEAGVLVDLQMFGEDGGDTDSVTFATQVPLEEGATFSPWGLARVHYSVDGDFLIRTQESVRAQPRTWTGEINDRAAEKPTHTIVARGVKKFDMRYGFWNDHQWFESPAWSSNTRNFRSSSNLLGTYDDDELDQSGLGVEASQQNLNQQDVPLDGLPTYVRMEVIVSDPENDARTTKMSRIFRVPGSMETWVPNSVLDEDQRENEFVIREQDFEPVEPGALAQ